MGTGNPMYGKHLSDNHRKIIGNINRGKCIPKTVREKMRASMCSFGIFTFQNTVTLEMFTGTMYEFYTKYNIPRGYVYDVVNGRQKSCKKWMLLS